MSEPKASTIEAIRDWLKAHPREPFYFTWVGSLLLVGLSNDDGEIDVFEATVNRHVSHWRRKARSP